MGIDLIGFDDANDLFVADLLLKTINCISFCDKGKETSVPSSVCVDNEAKDSISAVIGFHNSTFPFALKKHLVPAGKLYNAYISRSPITRCIT